MEYFLAIDLGATSGRHVIGYIEDGSIKLKEIHRFVTKTDDSKDGLIWNLDRIFNEIKYGIKLAFSQYPSIVSLSIDSWGVDYVLMNEDKEIPPYYSYRNERTIKASKELHEIIPFEELYARTGIQFASFNTIYQLYDDLKKGRLDNATDYLMLPSYFTYKLTGIKTHEYTNESTGALLNAETKEYIFDIFKKIGLPLKLFNKFEYPTYKVGPLKKDIALEVGGNLDVILCASHDTACAYESLNVEDDSIILSSGTWSLLGVKNRVPIINYDSLKANYTNEGGVGYIRFLKNIPGLFISNKLKDELHVSNKYLAEKLPYVDYKEIFDINDPSLVAPKNMEEAIKKLLEGKLPKSRAELFSSFFHSLAYSYNLAIKELEGITKTHYQKIYIIGGGANNKFLNKLVGEYTNKQVIPLPIEASSLGNIKIQIKRRMEDEKRN